MEDMRQPGQHRSVKQGRLPTRGQAIRQFCLECLCVSSRRQAYDCLCVSPAACALYPAHPFTGKPMPASIAPKVNGAASELIAGEQAQLAAIAPQIPHRRPSATLIRRRCRDCNPEGRDCGMSHCALYPWNRRGTGAQPKRAISDRQREVLMAARKARSSPEIIAQKASSASLASSETIGTGQAPDVRIPASLSGVWPVSVGDRR